MPSVRNKFTWWERRTRIEKCSLVIITFSAILIIYLASNLFMKFPSGKDSNTNICTTPKCIMTAANIMSKMDNSANPCKDFYQFACGGFKKSAIIPDDQSSTTSISQTGKKVRWELRQIFEEPILEDEAKSLKLVKILYQSCMNTSRIESDGLRFVQRLFDDFGGWPVTNPSRWNEHVFDWTKLLYNFRKIGWHWNFFVSLYVARNPTNSSQRILTIGQSGLNVQRLRKGFNDTYVSGLYDYFVDLATIFGADKSRAQTEMREVTEFLIAAAKLMILPETRKNSSEEYNPMTIRQLQLQFSSISWLQYINSYLSPYEMLTSDDFINVEHPRYLSKLENLLFKTKKKTLANYMFSRVLSSTTIYLPEIVRNSRQKFLQKTFGIHDVSARWKICVAEATGLHIAVSSTYVKNYFNRGTKEKVSELIIDIKGSFMDSLRKITWMDRKTKRHAASKADKMDHFVGYPEEIFDNRKVEEYYEALDLDPQSSILEMVFNISKFNQMHHVKLLKEVVIKGHWKNNAYSYIINAFYDQSENAIELPAAILQEPFYDLDRPQYLNYGSLGSIIGHEITHGFDNRGRQYDKDGNLVDWWEPETNKTFTRRSHCLVEQYGNSTVPEIDMKLNGELSLGENIADNGGVKIAYKGYLRWLERNKGEPMLPGLPYTPRQMFWIASGINWCAKYRKEELKHMVLSNVHSPSYFRLTIPFMNSDNFGKDFNCKLGSPMNPKYKCRVW